MNIKICLKYALAAFALMTHVLASGSDAVGTDKPLFIAFHGLGGNGQFGEEVARQFSELAPIYLGSGSVNNGEAYELYSPSALNGQWFDPAFALTIMPGIDVPTRDAFLNALSIDANGDINIDALGNESMSAQITLINQCLNAITADVRGVINNRSLSKVAIIGQSLGGITAWFVANKLNCANETRLGALITDSAPYVWLCDSARLPVRIVVNTPTEDCFFKLWFDECHSRLSNNAASHSNIIRHLNTIDHCMMSDAFREDVGNALLSVIRFPASSCVIY